MGILNTYEIQPVDFENSGVWGLDTLSFLHKVGDIVAECRYGPREH